MCIEISSGFMLLAALLWLLDGSGVLSALLPAVIVHELGHGLALLLCGCRIRLLRLEACGLRMDYCGSLGRKQELLCVLAGPVSGLAYALICAAVGRRIKSAYLLCSAGASLLLSLFNLLPAPMLDGGRVLSLLRNETSVWPGLFSAALLLVYGGIFLEQDLGLLLLAAGLWTAIGTCKYARCGIK